MASWHLRDDITWMINAQRYALLGDGTAVFMVPTADAFVFYQADRWGEPQEAFRVAGQRVNGYALVSDWNDDLHLAVNLPNGTTTYQRFTRQSGGWVPNAAQVVEGAIANRQRGRIDLDILDDDSQTVVIAFSESDMETNAAYLKVQARTLSAAGPVWWTVAPLASPAINNTLMCTVARNDSTEGSFAVAWTGNTESPPHITTFTVGADQTIAPGATVAYAGPYRQTYGMLFTVGPDDWLLMMASYAEESVNIRALRFNPSGATFWSTNVTEATTAVRWQPERLDRSEPSFAFINGTAVFFSGSGGGGIYAKTAMIDSTAWSERFPFAHRGATVSYRKMSGANRNIWADEVDIVFAHEETGRFYFAQHEDQMAPANVRAWAQRVSAPLAPDGGSGYLPAGLVSDDRPILYADLPAKTEIEGTDRGPVNYPRRVQWRIGLTPQSGGRRIAQPSSQLTSRSSATPTPVPAEDELYQTTWYLAAQALDAFNVGTEFFSDVRPYFIVHHPPSVVATSPVEEVIPFIDGSWLYRWRFADPSPWDFQTAYRVVIEQAFEFNGVPAGTVVADTEKVSSDRPEAEVVLDEYLLQMPLRWRVMVWDSDDVSSHWSNYGMFSMAPSPTLEIMVPADQEVVHTPSPLVGWVFSGSDDRPQTERMVQFYEVGPPERVIHETGWVATSDDYFMPDLPLLKNNTDYSVRVTARDETKLTGVDVRQFSTSWIPPVAPPFVVDGSRYDLFGYVEVGLDITDDEAVRDADFMAWRVYRRVLGEEEWVFLHESTAPAVFVYEDWLAPANVALEYVMVQVAGRFAEPVESEREPLGTTATAERYWLVHPGDRSKSLPLHSVVSDSYSDEYEEATLNLIGRGRKVEHGTRFGYTGTLVAQLRDQQVAGKTARQQKVELERLKAERREVFLRTPFGDVWQVSMSNVSISRVAGVGSREFVDVTVPYLEVV